MSTKRFPLFFTEILLLLLVTHLFWPIQTIHWLPEVFREGVFTFFQIGAGCVVCLLPGWWRTHLFFNDTELSFLERIGMSSALSIAFLTFTRIYLVRTGSDRSYALALVVVSGRTLLGMITSLFVANRNRVTSNHTSL